MSEVWQDDRGWWYRLPGGIPHGPYATREKAEDMSNDDMPPHKFVDTGVIALAFPGASGGRPVCGWDPDGQGVCDRYINDPIHTGFIPLGALNTDRCPEALSTPYGDRRCDLDAGHDGYHVRNDGCGRPEYFWGRL